MTSNSGPRKTLSSAVSSDCLGETTVSTKVDEAMKAFLENEANSRGISQAELQRRLFEALRGERQRPCPECGETVDVGHLLERCLDGPSDVRSDGGRTNEASESILADAAGPPEDGDQMPMVSLPEELVDENTEVAVTNAVEQLAERLENDTASRSELARQNDILEAIDGQVQTMAERLDEQGRQLDGAAREEVVEQMERTLNKLASQVETLQETVDDNKSEIETLKVQQEEGERRLNEINEALQRHIAYDEGAADCPNCEEGTLQREDEWDAVNLSQTALRCTSCELCIPLEES